MEHYNTYVGIDVHARTIFCKGLTIETGEEFTKAFFDCPSPTEIAGWFNSLPQPLYCAYESGCTRYTLARELRELNISCDIIAITSLARSTKEKLSKYDKIDASTILIEIANPIKNYSVVWIHGKEIEAYRSFARTVLAAAKTVKSLKCKEICFTVIKKKILFL